MLTYAVPRALIGAPSSNGLLPVDFCNEGMVEYRTTFGPKRCIYYVVLRSSPTRPTTGSQSSRIAGRLLKLGRKSLWQADQPHVYQKYASSTINFNHWPLQGGARETIQSQRSTINSQQSTTQDFRTLAVHDREKVIKSRCTSPSGRVMMTISRPPTQPLP